MSMNDDDYTLKQNEDLYTQKMFSFEYRKKGKENGKKMYSTIFDI